ncbi:MAG: hypothetical protein ACXWC9_04415 [Pseudobdellovibrionaceae bacterium]
MIKTAIFLMIVMSPSAFAKDCGPVPPGASFGPNCEIIAMAPPESHHGNRKVENGWELIKVGSYSGRVGYFVRIGRQFQLQLDAIIMNEVVAADLVKNLSKTHLSEVKICSAKGMQQAIGYTLFKIKNCK